MIENLVPWPNGAKCAAAFTFDIDTDSFLHLLYGEGKAGQGGDNVPGTAHCITQSSPIVIR